MTFRDDLPHRDELEDLDGRVGDDAAWSETAETAPTDEHEPPARQESSAEAIPWKEPPKRPGRPANATLLIGLGVAGAVVLVIAIVWAMFTKHDSSSALENSGDPFASSSASAQSASPSSSGSASSPGLGEARPSRWPIPMVQVNRVRMVSM